MNDDELIDAWRALAARSRRGRDAEAEDHVQDAVVAALDVRRRTGRSPDSAGAWLRTVARRREVDQVRRAQCERRVAAAAFADETGDDVAGEVLDRHEARWLAGHVDRLPATTRDVVRALAAGRTQGEVATLLGLTTRAVEAHVRRARLALRRALERAGAVVGLLLGFRGWRHWRRGAPLVAASGAAALGVALMGTGEVHRLIPIPPPPKVVLPTPDAEARVAPHPGGLTVRPPAFAPVAPPARATHRAVPTEAPRPPAPRESEEPPPPPSAVPPGVFLVSSDGTAKPVPTEAGVWYDVTVAGTYIYNGRATGRADCGHWIPESTQTWSRYEALLIDGVRAPCAEMPLDPLHTYRWRLLGTGSAMTFRVKDFGYRGDNIGEFVITLTPVVGP